MRADLFTCDRCKDVATTGECGSDELTKVPVPEMPEGWMRVTVDVQKLGEIPDAHKTLDLCVECGTMVLELVTPVPEPESKRLKK